MVSHIVGGAFGLLVLVTCVIKASVCGGAVDVTGAAIYGGSMVVLYTMSSLYHGLKPLTAKKVFQIIDHCTIYLLIAGTYTPISLTGLMRESVWLGWGVFGGVWALAALGIVFNSIDLRKYRALSMVLYIVAGWCIIFTGPIAIRALTLPGFLWVLAGGIVYTIGTIFYGVAALGRKPHRYIHSVFHLFVVAASVLQYIGIILYLY